mmetsp:Transcript_4303/g.12884  ORF Transcript_4303/g.12884 Transcript_4303/m.12884 type:complete len:200 (+) Transcript_4303:219-818(+)
MPDPVARQQTASGLAVGHLHAHVAAQLALGVDVHGKVPGGRALATAGDRAEGLPEDPDVVGDVPSHRNFLVKELVLPLQPLALGFPHLLPSRAVGHHGTVQTLVPEPAETVAVGVILAVCAMVQLQVQGAHVEGEVHDGPLAFAVEVAGQPLAHVDEAILAVFREVPDAANTNEPGSEVLEVAKTVNARVRRLPRRDVR